MLDNYDYIAFSCFEDDLDTVLPLAAGDELIRPVPTDDWRKPLPLDPGIIYKGAPNESGAVENRVVFFAPEAAPGRTVMFASSPDGWSSLAYRQGLRLQGSVINFTLSSNSEPWPKNAFRLRRGSERIRQVLAMKDSNRWVFVQEGEPLPEEDTASYARRRVRDRLDRQGLVALARRLGWPIDQDDFWRSRRAHYFQQVFDRGLDPEAWARKLTGWAREHGGELLDGPAGPE